jgi:hypothetical protein
VRNGCNCDALRFPAVTVGSAAANVEAELADRDNGQCHACPTSRSRLAHPCSSYGACCSSGVGNDKLSNWRDCIPRLDAASGSAMHRPWSIAEHLIFGATRQRPSVAPACRRAVNPRVNTGVEAISTVRLKDPEPRCVSEPHRYEHANTNKITPTNRQRLDERFAIAAPQRPNPGHWAGAGAGQNGMVITAGAVSIHPQAAVPEWKPGMVCRPRVALPLECCPSTQCSPGLRVAIGIGHMVFAVGTRLGRGLSLAERVQ